MELPGRCGDWLDTATVTVQGSRSGSTRRARGGDFYLATSGDLQMATCGDFLMATDNRRWQRSGLYQRIADSLRTECGLSQLFDRAQRPSLSIQGDARHLLSDGVSGIQMNHPFYRARLRMRLCCHPMLAQVPAFDDTIVAATLLDRLLHRSLVLDIGGDSYRAFFKIGRQPYCTDTCRKTA